MMKNLLFILGILCLVGIAGAFDVSVEEAGTNYLKWNWTESPITGINIDGKLITNYDPAATSYILSNLNADEIHQITVYSSGGDGTNSTRTLPEEAGDVPLGIWIYGIPALLCLLVARYARIAVVNVITVIFGLYGLWQLLSVKATMDGSVWTLSLIVYFILIFIGFVAWAAQTGRVWK